MKLDAAAKQRLVADGAVDVEEASRQTGLSRTQLYRLMDRGELRYCKLGKRRLVPRSELTRLLAGALVES